MLYECNVCSHVTDNEDVCPQCYSSVKQVGLPTHILLYSEHLELLKDQKVLRALEAAGVNNWEGYSHAIEMLGDHS
jgi:hypothetical protein